MSWFTFSTNAEQKAYVEHKLSLHYPNFRSGGSYFREFLSAHTSSDTIVLDAGCGNGGMVVEMKGRCKKMIGVDVNEESLSRNTTVDETILSDLESIPLADASIDVIASEFVLEHLAHPENVFAEFYRLLKPHGIFIFLTPNLYNPVMLTSKYSPHWFHKLLRGKLLKKQEEAHKTWYRANTYQTLHRLLSSASFHPLALTRAGNPEYVGFARPLVIPAIYLEKLLTHRPVNCLQMYLVGCFQKQHNKNSWETVVDFTKLQRGGVNIDDVLNRLNEQKTMATLHDHSSIFSMIVMP